jgi:LPXTG-site transpeptidase (sortase) family protein
LETGVDEQATKPAVVGCFRCLFLIVNYSFRLRSGKSRKKIMPKLLKSLFLLMVLAGSLFIYPVEMAYAIAIPAEINKQFTPILINAGGISVLRVTVFNPNTFPLTNANWTDNLVGVQPGLKIATPNGLNNTCGGSVTATSNTTSLSLIGGSVPAQIGATPGECYVEINVTSTTVGNLINTIPTNTLNASGSDNGTSVTISNTTPASATITVVPVAAPTLSKGFNPNTIFVGDVSQLTITINNNDTNTNLTGTSFTDTLPANVVLANPPTGPTPLTNCGGTASLAATAGGNTIALTNATVTPAQNCIVTVNVTSSVSGQYINTIPAGPGNNGSIVTQQGVTNANPASANLNVQPIGVTKNFSPATITAGGTSLLTITLQNPTGSNYTGVGITDNLPAGLTISGTPAASQCGGTVSSTATSITLAGGVVPASVTPPTPVGTCTITATVRASLTTSGTLNNTIPANSLTAAQPGVTNTSPAQRNLNVNPALTGTKVYSPTSIAINGVSTVTVTLNNNSATNLTGVNFTDTLPANLNISGVPVSPQCNGTITNTVNSVTLAGGSILAGTSCTLVFNVTSSVPGSGTTYENTIPTGTITTNQGVGNTSTIRTGTDLTVVNSTTLPVNVSKAFQTSPILPGAPSRLRITITAPVDTNLTGLNISDPLTGLVIVGTSSVPPAPANPTDTCAGANVVAPIGGNTISLSGANLNAGATCTITVYVTSTNPGSYNNTIPANNITTTQDRTNVAASNTATLVVTNMSMSKAFYPPSVQTNGLSTLTITLQNTNTSPLINVQLTDNLPGSVTDGVVVAPIPNASTTCAGGAVTANPGSQIISMTGATVPAQSGAVPGICTITVIVQGKDSNATPSNRTNTIPTANVSGTVQNTGVTINPIAQAQAVLRTEPLSIGVVKGFNPVLVYGGAYSTMSVQLVNPNNTDLTGIAFTDNMTLLGSGIKLANPVTFNVGTCGGALTGNPGDSSFSFSGGVLTANSNCTLTLRVVMEVNGNLTNRIPAGAVTTFNGASSTQPTEASLTNLPGASVLKSFNPDAILAGGYSTLTITIQNTSNIPLLGMALTDNLPTALPSGIVVAGASAPAPVNNCGGSFSAPFGSQTISLTGGSLAGNSNCTISVSVTSDTPNTYVNTIPIGGLTATAGGTPVSNNNPSSATLTVNAGSGYSLGNRVWFDTDNSGTINGTEVGISGVRVELYQDNGGTPGVYDATDSFLSYTTTDANGYYRFDNLPAGDYVVLIPADNFRNVGAGDTVPGNPLAGYWSSETTIGTGGAISDSTANDADTNPTDSDDNGISSITGSTVNYVAAAAVTLGPGTNEPTGETDLSASGQGAPDNQANMTLDFGFYRSEIGNLVFVDVNNNGTYDASDTLLSGARVQLYSSNGTEINVGPDGVLGTADDAAGGMVTGAGGTYQFSGLPAGDYKVGVTPPSGYTSTVDTAAPTDTSNPNTNINNNDNGVGTGSGQVLSNIVTLTPGSVGAASNNSVNNTNGTTTNPTVDFGFNTPLFSLGNRVWFDTDNSGTINGSEVGINAVDVDLYRVDGLGNTTFVASQTTANGGYYRFDKLPAGDYIVVIPASEFGTGGTLKGYWSSGTTINGAGVVSETTAPSANTDIDNDDNGDLQTGATFTGAVVSSTVTLGPSANEPTNDTDANPANPPGEAPNDRSNRTVDFGFYRTELGDLVFGDVNNNGVYDAGDTLLAGATVRLYSSNGTEINVGPDGILGTADDTAGGVITGANGAYLFSGLPAGDYKVKVTPPLGYTSTVDVNADTTTPNNNVDNNDNGIGVAGGQVSSNVVSLIPGVTGASTTVTNGTGTTHNPSLDFGFVLASGFLKKIETTNQTFTADPNVAIGEIITYQVSQIIPPGTYTSATLVDTMERGLAFVGCDTIDAPGLTTSVTGGFTSICASPTADDAGGGTSADVDRRVAFDFGTLTNESQSNVTLTITYRAMVLDIVSNVDGTTLKNSAVFDSSAGSVGPAQTSVKIIEPDIAIAKTADVNFIANGSAAIFTLVISNTSTSNTDAFDVTVSDVLPAGLDYVANSIDCTGGEQDPDIGTCVYDTTTRSIRAHWSVFKRLPTSDRGIIRFGVVGNASIPSNGTLTNVANVDWSSIPGKQDTPLSFSTPPNPFATERYYDPVHKLNFYNASASLVLTPLGGGDNGGDGGGGRGRDSISRSSTAARFLIPVTGFAPNTVTELNIESHPAYKSTNVMIEIPTIKLKTSIVGVPLKNGTWDPSLLLDQVGWLNGTAYPTWAGNSVLMGHVVNTNGKPSILFNLKYVNPGEFIYVYGLGYRYTYKVVSNKLVLPDDISVLKHEDKAYLTLITCDAYDERSATYLRRVAVRAELVDVREAK